MDPLSIISTALVTGAAVAVTDTASQVIKDAYNGFKSLLMRKFGPGVSAAADVAEKLPGSDTAKTTTQAILAGTNAGQDAEVLDLAKALIAALEKHASQQQIMNNTSTNNSDINIQGSTVSGGVTQNNNNSNLANTFSPTVVVNVPADIDAIKRVIPSSTDISTHRKLGLAEARQHAHDLNVFKKADKILPEASLHSLRSSVDFGIIGASDYSEIYELLRFASHVSNEFLDKDLQRQFDAFIAALKILEQARFDMFVPPEAGMDFYLSPSKSSSLEPAIQHEWAEERDQVCALVNVILDSYRNYRRLIKHRFAV